jgi:uncharacterized membrane protein
VLLAIGFTGLFIAILSAWTNPATGYELSLYSLEHTPLGFWFGITIGLAVAFAVSVFATQDRPRWTAYLLGGATMTAVVGLPLLRGYYFYGQTDSLIHLGWTRAISAGILEPGSMLYPAAHLSSVLLGDLAGIAYRRAILLVVVFFVVIYFVFVPLVVRTLTTDRLTITIAVFSGMLLLPLNNVSTFLRFHPFSLALLFLPVVLYLLIRYIKDSDPFHGVTGPLSVMLLISGIGLLMIHPQLMLNFLLLLGAITAYQIYHRWIDVRSRKSELAGVHVHFVVLGALFYLWISNDWQLFTTIEQTLNAIANINQGAEAGEVIDQRAGSATAIGVGLPELFLKLFSVSVLYFGLGVMYIVERVNYPYEADRSGESEVYAYFFYGGLALIPLVVVNFFGQVSTYFFRHVGFGMVIMTIVGAIAIRRYGASVTELVGGVNLKTVVSIVIALSLILSLAALFPSPYIYLPNHHVSEAQMSGYETAFEHQLPGAPVWFGGIRTTTNRYESALIDTPFSIWSGAIPGPALANPQAYYRTHQDPSVRRDHYIIVTTYDIEREVSAYGGLRYTASQLEAIESAEGVHRIGSNGEFTLYYVDLESQPEPQTG